MDCSACGTPSLSYAMWNTAAGRVPNPPADLKGSTICRPCWKGDPNTLEARIRAHAAMKPAFNMLNFWCPKDGISINPAVLIKIPDICCTVLTLIAPNPAPGSVDHFVGYCKTHLGSYVDIWNNYNNYGPNTLLNTLQTIAQIEKHEAKKFDVKRFIAPDGTDGLMCLGCQVYYPYVEPNCSVGYNCPCCR